MGRRRVPQQEQPPEKVKCTESIIVIPNSLTVCDVDLYKDGRTVPCYLIWSDETPTESYTFQIGHTQDDFETYVRPYVNGISNPPSKSDIAILQGVIMRFVNRNRAFAVA